MAGRTAHLIEASWEVCNKVGGIHTVISSKLSQAQAEFPAGYLTVGPYLSDNTPAFHELVLPDSMLEIAKILQEEGVGLHYGLWLPFDQPTVLLEWSHLVPRLNDYKSRFWEHYALDTLGTDFYDVDQPLLWSIAVGLFAHHYNQRMDVSVILQAHEWLTAGALLTVRLHNNKDIHSVFTTHATVLGRALSSRGVDIYHTPPTEPADNLAAQYGVVAKHQLERLGAHLATVFTTVSQLTAREAESFLGRKPEVITENGLDSGDYPTFGDLTISHRHSRQALDDFTAAYFFPSYTFDLSRVSYQFSMGRYEIHNKGYDLYLQSLGALNQELKAQRSTRTVISYLLIPADTVRLQPAVTGQILLYRRLQQLLKECSLSQQAELYRDLCEERSHLHRPAIPAASQRQLRDLAGRLLRPSQPAISPYELRHPEQDGILRLCEQYGLQNREEDRVKIVYFPVYCDGFDGIFNLPLYTLISGFDLGVFPSVYEPWGYTPMESLLMGVPAVTSTLAGFGQSLASSRRSPSLGTFILDRYNLEADAPRLLLQQLQVSLHENEHQWEARRIAAYQTIQEYGWNHLYANYRRAYSLKPAPQG